MNLGSTVKRLNLVYAFVLTNLLAPTAYLQAAALQCKDAVALDTLNSEVKKSFDLIEQLRMDSNKLQVKLNPWMLEEFLLAERIKSVEPTEWNELNVGDLKSIQKELRNYNLNLDQFIAVAIENKIDLKVVYETRAFLKSALKTKSISYFDFLSLSEWMADYSERYPHYPAFKLESKKMLSQMHERRGPDHRVRGIPTTITTSIETMNLFALHEIAFLGVIFKPELGDGGEMRPLRYLGHDLGHFDIQPSGKKLRALADKIFSNAPPEQMRMRHLLFFYYWHETGNGQSFSTFLSGSWHGTLDRIGPRMRDDNDFGQDRSLVDDYNRNFEATLKSLRGEFE